MSRSRIPDKQLRTIETANKVAISSLDIDGASDIGAALVDADLFIVDDGAGGCVDVDECTDTTNKHNCNAVKRCCLMCHYYLKQAQICFVMLR